MIVLCPLAVEARGIRSELADVARVEVAGPGPARIREAVERWGGQAELIVLTGLAGGLRVPTGALVVAKRVIDERGRSWTPTHVSPPEHGGGITTGVVIGCDRVHGSVRAKEDLSASSGADIVDTESHAFASACVAKGVGWSVCRAVSDGPEESLPLCAPRWVDESGRSLAGRVLLDVVRGRASIGEVRRLARASRAGVSSLGGLVRDLIVSRERSVLGCGR